MAGTSRLRGRQDSKPFLPTNPRHDQSGLSDNQERIGTHPVAPCDGAVGPYGISFLEFIELTARYRGVQSGCLYAEGFRHWRVWPGRSAVGLLP